MPLDPEFFPWCCVGMAVHDRGVGIEADLPAPFSSPSCHEETGRQPFEYSCRQSLSGGERRPAGRLPKTPKGTGVVVLVEDEKAACKLVRMILTPSGYVVNQPRNGREGLERCAARPGGQPICSYWCLGARRISSSGGASIRNRVSAKACFARRTRGKGTAQDRASRFAGRSQSRLVPDRQISH